VLMTWDKRGKGEAYCAKQIAVKYWQGYVKLFAAVVLFNVPFLSLPAVSCPQNFYLFSLFHGCQRCSTFHHSVLLRFASIFFIQTLRCIQQLFKGPSGFIIVGGGRTLSESEGSSAKFANPLLQTLVLMSVSLLNSKISFIIKTIHFFPAFP
jgi:hypothetical protein